MLESPACRQLGCFDAAVRIATLPNELLCMTPIKVINVKTDLPSVHEALQRLDREIALARKEKHSLLKVIHGYGSTGVGGDIRMAVQRRLQELAQSGQIRQCIFGEDWSRSNEQTWRLLQTNAELKSDPDLGRRNQGITIICL